MLILAGGYFHLQGTRVKGGSYADTDNTHHRG